MNQCPYCKGNIEIGDNRCVYCKKWLIGLNHIEEFMQNRLDDVGSLVGHAIEINGRTITEHTDTGLSALRLIGISALDKIDDLTSVCIEKLDGYSPSQQAKEYYNEFMRIFQDYKEFARYERMLLLNSGEDGSQTHAKARECLKSAHLRTTTLSKMSPPLEMPNKEEKGSEFKVQLNKNLHDVADGFGRAFKDVGRVVGSIKQCVNENTPLTASKYTDIKERASRKSEAMANETERVYRNHVKSCERSINERGLFKARLYGANFASHAAVMSVGMRDPRLGEEIIGQTISVAAQQVALSRDELGKIAEEIVMEHNEALSAEQRVVGSGQKTLAKIYTSALEESLGPIDKLTGEFSNELPLVLGSIVSGALAEWAKLCSEFSC